MIPKRPVKHEENVDAWLMSYADMITLLLCFFIIFVSVSEPKKDKLTQVAEGMVGKFGAVNYENPFAGAVRALQAVIEKNEMYRDVAVEGTSKTVAVELSTHRFFKNGGAEMDEAMQQKLDELVVALQQAHLVQQTVSIESHTDDAPPQSGLWTSNWELSAVRAAKIASYFTKRGFSAKNIQAVGYGDARPKVPNLTENGEPIEENRLKNQRIVIKLTQ